MKILALHVSGLHLGYIGCYGNEWVDTPALDRFAAEGIVFDQHYADCPGKRTCWTGRYCFPLPDAADAELTSSLDLPKLLARGGVPFTLVRPAAAGDEGEAALECTLGFAQDAIEHQAPSPRWLVWVDLPALLPPWTAPEDYLERYLAEEEAPEDDEEVMEPLTPWLDPPTGPIDLEDLFLLDRLQSSYAAAVTFFDDCLGRFLDQLRADGRLEEMTVLVTGDRGLALSEHGMIADWRPWLHDELIHLPLLLRLPNAEESGRRVAALTQPVDLLPTLLDLFGMTVEEVIQGHNLLPVARGKQDRVRDYACSGLAAGDSLEWALRTPAWGFVLPLRVPESDAARGPQLYVKPDDRWEVNNVVQHHLERSEALERTLHSFLEATRQEGSFQPPPLSESIAPDSLPGEIVKEKVDEAKAERELSTGGPPLP